MMPICSALCGEPDSVVVQVDSISITEINGLQIRTQHIRWLFPWNDEGEWFVPSIIYEGIGNVPVLYFFFRHPCGALTHSDVISLNCYESPTHGTFNFRGEVPCNQFLNTPTDEPVSVMPQLLLSPNPATNELELRFTPQLSGWVQVRIFDAQGRLVEDIQKELTGTSVSLPVTGWPAGLYVLQCIKDGAVLGAEKFVKQ